MSEVLVVPQSLEVLATTVRREVNLAVRGWQTSLEHAYLAGAALNEAKARVGHGGWIPWVEANFDFNQGTANQYMRLAAAGRDQIDGASSISEALRPLTSPRRVRLGPVESPPLPPGVFRTFVIDPSWPYPGGLPYASETSEYPPQTEEQLRALTFNSTPDAHLYLWTTQHFRPLAYELLDVWGWNYVCEITWDKMQGPPTPNFRYTAEACIFAKRGSLPTLTAKYGLVIRERPKRPHSRKPDRFYRMVTNVSPGPRVEYNSRTTRDGFEPWGDQVGLLDGVAA